MIHYTLSMGNKRIVCQFQCQTIWFSQSLNSINVKVYHLLDSLVVESWLRVREVPGSIPSQGPRHTKDVIKMVPVVPWFSTQH